MQNYDWFYLFFSSFFELLKEKQIIHDSISFLCLMHTLKKKKNVKKAVMVLSTNEYVHVSLCEFM